MKRLNFWVVLVLTAAILPLQWGCDSWDASEPIPAMLYIDTVMLDADNNQGTERHDVREVWVSVGNQLLGAFPLPARIPVLEMGEQEVSIFCGIVQNGVAITRDIYPFYDQYRATVDLQPGETDTLSMTIQYADETEFVFIEDFETSNLLSDDIDGNFGTSVSTSTIGAYEGNRSGVIELAGADNLIEVGSNLYYALPEDARNVYVEFDYQNDVQLEVGIAGKSAFYFERFYKVGVFPSNGEWRKVYVDLTTEVRTMLSNSASEFQLVFRALNIDADNTAVIRLDNIKLIYR